jgi:hypothetical protein
MDLYSWTEWYNPDLRDGFILVFAFFLYRSYKKYWEMKERYSQALWILESKLEEYGVRTIVTRDVSGVRFNYDEDLAKMEHTKL